MAFNSFVSNQGTQTAILTDNTGGVGGTVIAVQKVDISPQGTAGTIWNGNVGVTGGTINTIGTLPNIPNGTIGLVNTINTIGTLPNILGGTITNLVSGTINAATVSGNVGISSGTINLGTAVLNSGTINVGTFVMPSGTITNGTILSSGTTTGVGSVSSLGSLGMLNAGTITTLPNIPGGTINILTNGTLSSSGTSTGVGTVTNLGSVTNLGQVYNAGTVQTILAGTITNIGTVLGVGSVSGIGGTVVAFGTSLVLGTFFSAATGTNSGTNLAVSGFQAAAITVTGTWVGTIATEWTNDGNWWPLTTYTDNGYAVGTIITSNGGYHFPVPSIGTIRARVATYTSGTVTATGRADTSPFSALVVNANMPQALSSTIDSISNVMTAGTVTTGSIVVTAGTMIQTTGTINTGTINLGTFVLNPVPTIAQQTFGTHGTTGVSIFGTLAGGTGSGAGTEIFLSGLSFSIPSTGGSQDISIGWGTNSGTFQSGTGLIVRGNFPPGGGIVKTFNPAINSGTNAQLCLFQAGAGTVDVSVNYFIAISTL